FKYYYYTNKLYHSTLKTEIIPSEYVFITTYSNKDYSDKHENLYLYNLKTKEKKLFYVNKSLYNQHDYDIYGEYYDIKGNLTTNWTDTNMHANRLYEITNNRFGETFYNLIYYDSSISFRITKTNDYIQKAYKYSLTQPEIINKNDRGIYLFNSRGFIISRLCLQNEYYKSNDDYFEESGLLNYNSNGMVIVYEGSPDMRYSYSTYDRWWNEWFTYNDRMDSITKTVYFQLNNKSLIKPTWNEVTNDFLNYRKSIQKRDKVFYTKEEIEKNLRVYNDFTDTKYLGFIPIEEFEYYLK
ncbi:hypothetical protein, partial [Brachyspira sp.]|uniref:hypothetical protein n=1 Tax=Brachyspira sp. TaxID=1977261 RepID=UPI003D7CDE24